MHSFDYQDRRMHCESVPLEKIAAEVGTPCYIYSRARIVGNYCAFDQAFVGVAHQVCFAVKSNSNLSILKVLADLGSGFDIVSAGELYRVQKIGADPDKILFSGVGKTAEEIKAALQANVLLLNLESESELEMVQAIAAQMKRRPRIAFRINPDVDPKTHPYISTGQLQHKFGIQCNQARELYRRAARAGQLEIAGISCHIGSQITELDPFVEAFKRLSELAGILRSDGIAIEYLDLGGGLGIRYREERPPSPDEYARAVLDHAENLGCQLLFEPGRVIVGNAGILLTRLLHVKETEGKLFYVVDAAMNDLIRPTLYQSYHRILPVCESRDETVRVDVVGPVCETGDFLARNHELRRVQPGSLLAVMNAGAYGFALASNYNSRPRCAEVLVDGNRYAVVRRRESLDDLIRGEVPMED